MTTTTLSCDCGQPTPESAFVCESCTDELWRALEAVPTTVEELDITLAKQRRFEYQTSSARSAVDELPFDVAASNTLRTLTTQLRRLVHLCELHDVRHSDYLHRDAGSTAQSMSAWLLWRVDGITQQPWAVDALRIARTIERAEHVVDRPAERSYAGPCDECGRDLYARKGKLSVTCVDCGLEYELAPRRQWLLSLVDDRLATASDLARALTSLALPVTADRIWQWKHRERIVVRGHDALGRPLYRVGDVVALLHQQAKQAS